MLDIGIMQERQCSIVDLRQAIRKLEQAFGLRFSYSSDIRHVKSGLRLALMLARLYRFFR